MSESTNESKQNKQNVTESSQTVEHSILSITIANINTKMYTECTPN